jgi:Xaa-Pro aminopeptidase
MIYFSNMPKPISSLFPDTIAVFAAHHAVQRNVDASFAFEQESNFFWLTKIEEPDWMVIIDGYASKSYLVAPFVPEHQKLFDGALEYDDARSVSGIATVLDVEEAEKLLQELSRKYDTVSAIGAHPHDEYFDFVVNPAQVELWKKLEKQFTSVHDCRLVLAKLRAIKSSEEIAAIRAAVDQTVTVFKTVKEKISEYQYEYEIEADLSYGFRVKGTKGHAYDPIVASGLNACTLHYSKNQMALPKDSFVLIDAGTKVNGYAADITRTYATGTPSARQKAVHTAVQKAHHEIIALLGPNVSVKDYHDQVDEIMKQALSDLDLLNNEDDYRTYFPHAISHGLGIDVHDSLGRAETFQPGMVLTVEPGIYIPEEGIGVRIEDDILITETGHENLSASLPTGL